MCVSRIQRWLCLTTLVVVGTAAGCRRVGVSSFADAPVIVISIDTLRADHLPMFGYQKVRTPNLQALRADSILYTSAYSSVPLTLPSHVSVLTGLLPPASHVRDNAGFTLDPSIPTLPKLLAAHGYQTGAAVSAYVLRGSTGLGTSFDFYDDAIAARANEPLGALRRSGFETVAMATRWGSQHVQRPFFFFLHLYVPHAPYDPPEPFRSAYAGDPYDGAIAAADAIVGEFIGVLKRDGVYDKAIIVLLSDHGEGLMDHGEAEHGIFLYRETIHVPLMLKLPHDERAGSSEHAVVGLIDIFPTIAGMLDLQAPPLPGVSLLHAQAGRQVYSETLYPRIHLGWSELRSLINSHAHFIEAPRPELYRIAADPSERANVCNGDRRAVNEMRETLRVYGSSLDRPDPVAPAERARFASLGYLASSSTASGPLPDPKDRIGEIAEMTAAVRLVGSRRNNDAIPLLRHLVEQNPRFADAWDELATCLESAGRNDEAAAALRQAIAAAPELAEDLRLQLGALLLIIGRLDDAAAQVRGIESTGAHMLRSRVALARGDLDSAISEARLCQTDPSTRWQAKLLEARALAQRNDAAQALGIADDVGHEAEGEAVESLDFVRGDALARMKRYGEAIVAFDREIAAFPRERETYASLALVYFLTARSNQAYATLERMVSANPNRRTILFAAHTLDALGDKQGAAIWRRMASRSDSDVRERQSGTPARRE